MTQPVDPVAGRPAGRGRVRRMALARGISFAGSQAAQVALVYQVYAATCSAAWVALAVAGTAAAGDVVAPLSGWIADRFDRRRVMSLSEMGGGAVYLALIFVSRPVVRVVLALAATIVGSPFRAASAAVIPNLLSERDLPWASAPRRPENNHRVRQATPGLRQARRLRRRGLVAGG